MESTKGFGRPILFCPFVLIQPDHCLHCYTLPHSTCMACTAYMLHNASHVEQCLGNYFTFKCTFALHLHNSFECIGFHSCRYLHNKMWWAPKANTHLLILSSFNLLGLIFSFSIPIQFSLLTHSLLQSNTLIPSYQKIDVIVIHSPPHPNYLKMRMLLLIWHAE